jgi:hypothetical protein
MTQPDPAELRVTPVQFYNDDETDLLRTEMLCREHAREVSGQPHVYVYRTSQPGRCDRCE